MSNEITVISYKQLRTLIGLLAFLIAPVCVIGGLIHGIGIKNSISDYYGTVMRDWFVVVLGITGACLGTYRGHDTKDRILSLIMGISAVGIAFFPCTNGTSSITAWPTAITKIFHGIFAAVFFVSMAYMSFFQFSQGNSKFNIIYRAGGILILVLCILFGVCEFLVDIPYDVLIVETLMLWTFGGIWFLKGRRDN